MADSRNKKIVENEFKEAFKHDKAKVQFSRISLFGLLEMSRQNLRQNFLESTTKSCSYCGGKGRIRNVEATATSGIRVLESEIITHQAKTVEFSGSTPLITYILNNKRSVISALESLYEVSLLFYIDESAGADSFFIEVKEEKTSQSNYRHKNNVVSPTDTEDKYKGKDIHSKKKIWKKNTKFQQKELNGNIDDGNNSIGNAKKPYIKKRVRKNLPNRENTSNLEEDNNETTQVSKKNTSVLKDIWKKIVE